MKREVSPWSSVSETRLSRRQFVVGENEELELQQGMCLAGVCQTLYRAVRLFYLGKI